MINTPINMCTERGTTLNILLKDKTNMLTIVGSV